MATNNDDTKKILQGILSGLYQQQARVESGGHGSNYIIAQDQQFLGSITSNQWDNSSLLNEYGPYGSKYSPTSIFNEYSNYGSRYGSMSINNPYCATPPKLFINGQFLAYITENRFLQQVIKPEIFFYNLKNNLDGLLARKIVEHESVLRQQKKQSFLEGSDGSFLGELTRNHFITESVFNKFGNYGSQFSPTSIFNKFGTYGSPYSQLSPFNQFSNQPPKVYKDGNFVAYLTKNQFLDPRIDPDSLQDWVDKNITY